jgi:hypothetical protein
MCWWGRFYVFSQASSFNLQKYIQRHINRKKLAFFPKMGIKNIIFLPMKKLHVLWLSMRGTSMPGTPVSCMGHVMHGHVMHAHIMHDHVMHAQAVHCKLYIRINSDMPTVAIGPKPV